VRHPPLRIVVVLCEDAAAYAVAGFEDFYFQAGAGQIYGGERPAAPEPRIRTSGGMVH